MLGTTRDSTHPRRVCVRLAIATACAAAGAATAHQDAQAARSTDAVAAGHDRGTLMLRYAEFDPLRVVPATPDALTADATHDAHIVQFATAITHADRESLGRAGARIAKHLPFNAYIVRGDAAVVDAVAGLSSVRWVGPYHPAYKLDEPLLQDLATGASGDDARLYSIQMLERGPKDQNAIAGFVQSIGGVVTGAEPEGFRIEARLTLDQLAEVANRGEVQFIDAKGPGEDDMDIVRGFGGADTVERIAGYTGLGVRAEVLDGGLRTTHVDFAARPPILHGPNGGIYTHGTPVYGIVFGDGSGDARYRGLLPDARGIFASYPRLDLLGGPITRYAHTAELVDPDGVYRAVFQTNSWGDPRTSDYTTISAQMDDIILLHDILITQSQSNSGDTQSRPQAWAKNIVSVGGIGHFDTAGRDDDRHTGASTGPAADGRIKPDLSHFYDVVDTTAGVGDTLYTTFGGTSGATPITAGHFGLLFQMWADAGPALNSAEEQSVFEARPHAATAKALMINTATPWPLGPRIQRLEQGWGAANVATLLRDLDRMLVVDETEVLDAVGDLREYVVMVPEGEAELKITLAFLDPAGTTSSTIHRINDLDLEVRAPDGTRYFGNNGLLGRAYSLPGGAASDVDTVENVFVEAPIPGHWVVRVVVEELNEDARLETPEIDMDYALVVRGIRPCRGDFDGSGSTDAFDFLAFQNAFDAGDPLADFDAGGTLDIFDFLEFVNAFVVGCER
ncbi:MAG: S8 family serine peptidase [Planctomycetota bacterium]